MFNECMTVLNYFYSGFPVRATRVEAVLDSPGEPKANKKRGQMLLHVTNEKSEKIKAIMCDLPISDVIVTHMSLDSSPTQGPDI